MNAGVCRSDHDPIGGVQFAAEGEFLSIRKNQFNRLQLQFWSRPFRIEFERGQATGRILEVGTVQMNVTTQLAEAIPDCSLPARRAGHRNVVGDHLGAEVDLPCLHPRSCDRQRVAGQAHRFDQATITNPFDTCGEFHRVSMNLTGVQIGRGE